MSLHVPALPIRDLIRNLVSADRTKVQTARARLTIQGGRAVEALIAVLEGGNDRLKLQVMPILAFIRDARAREPLFALLRDREPRIREAATRALAGFPCRETIVCIERLLKRELRSDVRVAAVQSLITIFDEGNEEGLHELLGVLLDPDEPRRVRHATFGLLPLLSSRERRGILKRLRNDRDQDIAARASGLEEEAARSEPRDEKEAPRLATELASSNHERWNKAMHGLIALGSHAIPHLISAMRSRHRDPEFASRAAMVLKGLGPRRVRPVVDYLDDLVEPLPLEALVDVVASLEDRPSTYRLRDVIESLEGRLAAINGFAGPDPYARVRGKAHLALARLGSRVAVADLKKTLREPSRRLDPDHLAAVAAIGTRSELPDLLRAYQREDPWMREKVREVFWKIMRREKIRHGESSWQALAHQDRQALREILDRRSARPVSVSLASRSRRPIARPLRRSAPRPRAGTAG